MSKPLVKQTQHHFLNAKEIETGRTISLFYRLHINTLCFRYLVPTSILAQ
jgi:hypothetical protein